jgi:hypothetical protein
MSIRNRPTPEGRILGAKMAQFCDESEPAARLKFPELPPRCNSCAFRAGPHVANGSPETQMDVLKCVMEGIEFLCHEPYRKDQVCSGWAMMLLAKDDASGLRKCPWPFSDEVNADVSHKTNSVPE